MDLLEQHNAFFDQCLASKIGTKAAVLWLAMTSLAVDQFDTKEHHFPLNQLEIMTGESYKMIFKSFKKLQAADLVFGSYTDESISCIIKKLY